MASRDDLRKNRDAQQGLQDAMRYTMNLSKQQKKQMADDLYELRKEYKALNEEVVKGEKATEVAVGKTQAAVSSLASAFGKMGAAAASAVVSVGASFAGLAASVALFNPALVNRFTWELKNLGAALGNIVQPIIASATSWFIRLNTWLTNLSPTTKKLIATVTALGTSFVLVAKFTALLTPALAALGAVTSAVLTIIITKGTAANVLLAGVPALVGLLTTAISGLITLVGGLAAYGSIFGDMAGGAGAFAEVTAALKEAFVELSPLLGIALDMAKAMGPLFAASVKLAVVSIKVMVAALAPLIVSMSVLVDLMQSLATGTLAFGVTSAAIGGFADFFSGKKDSKKNGGQTFAAGQAGWESVDAAWRRATTSALSTPGDDKQLGFLQSIAESATLIATNTRPRDVGNQVLQFNQSVYQQASGVYNRFLNPMNTIRRIVGG